MNRLKADPGAVIQVWVDRHLRHWQAAQRRMTELGRDRLVILTISRSGNLVVPPKVFLFWDWHTMMRLSPSTVRTLSFAKPRAGHFLALAIRCDEDSRSWARFCWLPVAHHDDKLPPVTAELGTVGRAPEPAGSIMGALAVTASDRSRFNGGVGT